MITMSTIRVARGIMLPVEKVRFLIVIFLPWKLPQLLALGQAYGWVIHLSYRIYSMMFTTTVIGLLLGFLFMPRTWCTVCPINTLSELSLKNQSRNTVGESI
jgi:polyferredoxin